MKKSVKTELTKERILAAGIMEFGTKGYNSAALNNMCSDSGISKGLIYHNFENRDEIYLHCVAYTLHAFVGFMKEQKIGNDLHKYSELRQRFFSDNPLLTRVFFEAVLQPPAHLVGSIRTLKRDFDEFNLSIYRSAIKEMTLRHGVTEQEAVEYFSIMQEMFNGLFSSPAYADTAFWARVSDHEARLTKMLDFMLYGVAREEDDR